MNVNKPKVKPYAIKAEDKKVAGLEDRQGEAQYQEIQVAVFQITDQEIADQMSRLGQILGTMRSFQIHHSRNWSDEAC